MGYLKNHLSSDDKQELLGVIEDYRQGLPNSSRASSRGNCQDAYRWHVALNRFPVPDWVPVPSEAWVHQQVYLHPYPKELMLRNHV